MPKYLTRWSKGGTEHLLATLTPDESIIFNVGCAYNNEKIGFEKEIPAVLCAFNPLKYVAYENF